MISKKNYALQSISEFCVGFLQHHWNEGFDFQHLCCFFHDVEVLFIFDGL